MLNLLNLLFVLAVPSMDINVVSEADYPLHKTAEDRDSVTEVRTHRVAWSKAEQCKYIGLMVPYVRDWEEVIKRGEQETILPPEPDKTVGHAFIFNKKLCEGKEAEPVLRVASLGRNYGSFQWGLQLNAQDINGMKLENRPKWFNQAFQRIERVAAHDATAKTFLESTMPILKAIDDKTRQPTGAATASAQ